MLIRLATSSDLEAMTAVLIGASPMDPVYPYRFPDRHLYPDEFAALCRRKCAEYLETSTVVVCELPHSAYSPSTPQVVAFAAWDMPSAAAQVAGEVGSVGCSTEPTSPTSPTLPTSPTTIGHATRQSAFRAALAKHKASLFDARHAPAGGHVFLKMLLCHPAFQRRGAGTALTAWGIEQARTLGVYTTVFASPMGLRLYEKLGFREVGRFRVQLEGEGEFLEIPAMALAPGVVGGMREVEGKGGLGRGECGRRVDVWGEGAVCV
ncbi:putative N-acetyltransferase ycf52-like protein [Staphylotrichum tortipilum]|uniref:N-acetyltransferase ycf52-like protein n=1 Tax=Staphylotrichum tortipilum TaxID=2831512 RepID=A0AAN6RQ03_9PEZI|nr:putative N-acetyltransferase ycf52-like protein [Staphylotrichum longicolle]